MTAQSGLVLHGEFIQGLGVYRWLEQEMPKPGSKRGYGPTQQVLPLLLMLTGGAFLWMLLRPGRLQIILATFSQGSSQRVWPFL